MTRRVTSLPDLLITIPAILLISLGTLVVYSSDPQLAVQQIIFAVIGLFLYWCISLIDFEGFNSYVNFLYISVLILLVIVFIVGIETRGSARWIQIFGWQFQPSEFAKPILILFLARFWTNHLPTWRNIGLSLLLIAPLVGLIFKQPDLGTALTMAFIWTSMLIGANVAAFKLALMGFLGLILAPLTWIFLKDYQKDRILSFLSPTRDPLGIGYNVIQSTIAVGSGEFFGRGLGRGTQSRLRFLPEFRTDFMFASIAEEFGFVGSVIVLSFYALLISRGLFIINRSRGQFGALLIFGVLGMLFFQIVVNMGMNIGVVPITGITLPLLSYGGSSLITTLCSLGFVASVSRFSRDKNFSD